MLVVTPLGESSDRKLSGDPNKKHIKAATMSILTPTVLRIFYLLNCLSKIFPLFFCSFSLIDKHNRDFLNAFRRVPVRGCLNLAYRD